MMAANSQLALLQIATVVTRPRRNSTKLSPPLRSTECDFMKNLFLAFLLLAYSALSFAEGGCPPGQYPQQGQGWKSCIPIPGQSGAVDAPQARWSDRWLAFATDTGQGILGTSINMSTMNLAESAAMDSCKAKGGTACKIALSMSNGCGSLAVGTKVLVTGHGATRDEAEKAAITKCSEDDTNCATLESLCSMAVRVQ
ncbi:DUF4189 domain-containing protein [Luteibacter pinisoli]|uniref:DUF4189 domain-containing protein n=1 Tax=Luteibacter pinisoli TaxID=2589080 RepID=A0A4Y5Z3C6_9GAMM|nr:DUF4189 domain-containing protein [Luteibacter pinisoli]